MHGYYDVNSPEDNGLNTQTIEQVCSFTVISQAFSLIL